MKKKNKFLIFPLLFFFYLLNPLNIQTQKPTGTVADKPFKPFRITCEKLFITGTYKPFKPFRITTEKLYISGKPMKKIGILKKEKKDEK